MSTIVRAVIENLRHWYFAPLTLWPVRRAAGKMSSEYYPYLVLKVAETKVQRAAGWVVEQAVAAAVPPPIAAAAASCRE
jgi:hypothetical protein